MEGYTYCRSNSLCGMGFHNNVEEKKRGDKSPYFHFLVLDETFEFMRARGFEIINDPETLERYPSIASDYFYGRKGNLEFKANRYPAGFSIDFYQNVVFKNPNGGEYDFDKYEKMPYLIRLSYINETNKILEFWKSKGYQDVSKIKYKLAEDKIKQDYVKSWHHNQSDMHFSLKDLDGPSGEASYNSKDRDGKEILNGDIKYFRARDGRLRRCRVYHNINNMWWCILSNTEYTNEASFYLFDITEVDLKNRRVVRDKKPLLKAKTTYGDQLVEVWRKLTTRQIANTFKKYMESLEIKKYDRKKEDNTNTYYVDGKSDKWHRVHCRYYKDSDRSSGMELEIVLRKEGGSYLIVSNKRDRFFEVSYDGVTSYKEDQLIKLIERHKPLFEDLFKKAAKTKAA